MTTSLSCQIFPLLNSSPKNSLWNITFLSVLQGALMFITSLLQISTSRINYYALLFAQCTKCSTEMRGLSSLWVQMQLCGNLPKIIPIPVNTAVPSIMKCSWNACRQMREYNSVQHTIFTLFLICAYRAALAETYLQYIDTGSCQFQVTELRLHDVRTITPGFQRFKYNCSQHSESI